MDFAGIADDVFVNLSVQTTMPLPHTRETVLHFFEAVQKRFSSMTGFFQRETGEFVLEADREEGSYRWAELHPNRLCAGFFNPDSLQDACELHHWLLERSSVYLGLSGLDIDSLDVLFGFNMDYLGNRDELVAEALLGDSPLGGFIAEMDIKPLQFEPDLVFSLDEQCYLQGRISVETRCSSFQVRTGQYEDEPISVYLTVRRFPPPSQLIDPTAAFAEQVRCCEDLCNRLVVPQIIHPIAEAIAAGQ